MVGVSNPMLRRSRNDGLRFNMGLTGGFALSTLVIAMTLLVTNRAFGLLDMNVRLLLFTPVVLALVIADAMNMTPQISRQVPHRFMVLPPLSRGVMWGLDLGMVFTTRKTTSLPWLVVAAALLVVGPGAIVGSSMAFASGYLAAVLIVSIIPAGRQVGWGLKIAERHLFAKRLRILSAISMLGVLILFLRSNG